MHARSGIWVAAIAVFALQVSLNFAEPPFYPELRPDIQKYQDAQRCPDMPEDYYLVYRNYLYDSNYGGTSRCVKFHRIPAYAGVHTPTKVSWVSPGYGRRYSSRTMQQRCVPKCSAYCSKLQQLSLSYQQEALREPAAWKHHTIFIDCYTCYIARHHYARGGYGCTLWRAASLVSQNRTDYCDFIFDVVCGNSPKYRIYDPACEETPGIMVTNKAPWSE